MANILYDMAKPMRRQGMMVKAYYCVWLTVSMCLGLIYVVAIVKSELI